MADEDRQAAWYRAVREGRPRGRHYGIAEEEAVANGEAVPGAEDVVNVGDEDVIADAAAWDAEQDRTE